MANNVASHAFPGETERFRSEEESEKWGRAQARRALNFQRGETVLFFLLIVLRPLFRLAPHCRGALRNAKTIRRVPYQGRRGGHEGSSEEERDESGGPHFVVGQRVLLF